MEVAWNQLDPRLRGVDGLDDIMRFDLQHFCRRMQPPDEPHYRCQPQWSPAFTLSLTLHAVPPHLSILFSKQCFQPALWLPADVQHSCNFYMLHMKQNFRAVAHN